MILEAISIVSVTAAIIAAIIAQRAWLQLASELERVMTKASEAMRLASLAIDQVSASRALRRAD
jgi:hypothetical protein